MLKKTIAIFLLTALLLSVLTACGEGNGGTVEGKTLFIYLCGSNLETKQGLASKNIDELLSADIGDMNIVIQTGGAKTWRHHDVSTDAAQRYEIKNGELKLIETLEQKNMGEAETLTDFLSWGQEQYPTNHNMLVLWDHGGGAAKGVCFDENYGFDGLTLSELHRTLEDAKLNTKFDIIGFDACLMATVETADAVQDFAEYMIASEEIEPSGGWDSLTPESGKYLSAIDFLLMETDGEGKRHILCSDNDITKDWDNLVFKSNFRGIILALDGHRLYFNTTSSTDVMIKFFAPVKVNGKRTNLIFLFIWDESYFNDGYYEAFGTWDGYDENGLPSNDYSELKKGDKVQVVTDVVTENGEEEEIFGEEFVIEKDGGEITELPIDGKTYQYVFVATDIFGNTFHSDMATFEMTKSYEELSANPLPDGEYAAKVKKIEPYDL